MRVSRRGRPARDVAFALAAVLLLLAPMAGAVAPAPAGLEASASGRGPHQGGGRLLVTTFTDGNGTNSLAFTGPGSAGTAVTVPTFARALTAGMTVRGAPFNATDPRHPAGIVLDLGNDGSVEYRFSGVGYGPLGRQDRYSNDATAPLARVDAATTNSSLRFRIPKSATLLDSSLRVEGKFAFTPGLDLNGTGAFDWYGYAVANAGDVNADGYDDVLVGSPRNDSFGIQTGAAFLYHGGPGMDSAADLTFPGPSAPAEFGWSVAGLGDVNGDSVDDLAIGAPMVAVGGLPAVGRVYVYFGGASMDNVSDLVLDGEGNTDKFGWAVAGTGDVDGDGYGDIVVGAPENHTNFVMGEVILAYNHGAGYLFRGGNPPNSAVDATYKHTITQQRLGQTVAGPGDLNGDGYNDIVLATPYNDSAAPDAGAAYVFWGGPGLETTEDVTLLGPSPSALFGISVASPGDWTGDGKPDLAVGAPRAVDPNATGQVRVFAGGSGMDAVADHILEGETAGDWFGIAVTAGGDVNADGAPDLLVGSAFTSTAGDGGGGAFVYWGGAVADNVSDTSWAATGKYDHFGQAVAGGMHLDADSYDDIVVASMEADTVATDAGRAVILRPVPRRPLNATIDLDGVGPPEWSRPGVWTGNETTGNLSAAIQAVVDAAAPVVTDAFGNSLVEVTVRLRSDSTCDLQLSGLAVRYDHRAQVASMPGGSNLTRQLDSLLGKAPGNPLTIPIQVSSTSAGRLILADLRFDLDEGPTTTPLPALSLPEDTVADLLDFIDYMDDDRSIPVPLVTNVSGLGLGRVTATFVGTTLRVDTSTGSANDNWTGSALLAITLTDSVGLVRPLPTTRVNITPVNDAPAITTRGGTVAFVGQQYRYRPVAVDAEDDALFWALAGGPAGAVFNSSSGEIVWTPAAGDVGTRNLTLSVSDSQATTDEAIPLVVDFYNTPPRFTSQPGVDAVVGVLYRYTPTTADDESDPVTVRLGSGPAGMAMDAGTGTISWIPGAAGTFPIALTASDPRHTVQQSYNLTVTSIGGNRLPVFGAEPPITGTAGWAYAYATALSDPDGDPVTLTPLDVPAGMIVVPGSTDLAWVPEVTQAGNVGVTVRGSDGKGYVDRTWTISVSLVDANRPPVITSVPPLEATAGHAYQYAVIASDPDGDPVVIEAEGLPAGMTLDGGGLLEWIPRMKDAGARGVALRASDGKGYARQAFTIQVTSQGANGLPLVLSKPPTTVGEGSPYRYPVDAADPDGDPLTYELLDGPPGARMNGSIVEWDPASGDAGTYAFRLRISDGKGYIDARWDVIVLPVAIPVELTIAITEPLKSQTVRGNVTIRGTAAVVRGTANVTRVEVNGGDGVWQEAAGTTTWSIGVDLAKRQNGPVTIRARAWAGGVASPEVSVNVNLKNERISVPEPDLVRDFLCSGPGILLGLLVIAIIIWLALRGRSDRAHTTVRRARTYDRHSRPEDAEGYAGAAFGRDTGGPGEDAFPPEEEDGAPPKRGRIQGSG